MMERINTARRALRETVWWIDAFAALLGWLVVLLLVLTAVRLELVSYLLGDFFDHYAAATEAARGSFNLFAGIALLVVFAVAVALRWHTRATFRGEGR